MAEGIQFLPGNIFNKAWGKLPWVGEKRELMEEGRFKEWSR